MTESGSTLTAGAHRAGTSHGIAPLLIEFETASIRRPSDYGHLDERELSIGFISLELHSGNQTAAIDFRRESPSSFRVLYGLGGREPWGTWGTGRRTAFLFDPGFPIRAGSCLRLSYLKAPPFGLPVTTRIFLNGYFAAQATLDDTALRVEVEHRHVATAGTHGGNVSLDTSVRPVLSVIMVSLDRPDLVFSSIATLVARPPGVPFELILVENGTRADLRSDLDALGIPIRNIVLDKAVSFGEANNIGAEQARGEALLLINNDVFVQENCVAALFHALGESPDVAAIGPVFRYPDGRLQEAGGFLTPDGLMQVSEASRYAGRSSFATDVDYISAACLMMWRRDFEAAGGFDPVFEPAYYEDADLCLRLRRWLGRRIRLLPEAEAIHIRNATSADPAQRFPLTGANALNHENFLTRWHVDQGGAPSLPHENAIPAPHQFSFAVISDPAASKACEASAILVAAQLSQLAPTMLVGGQPRSGFRVAAILREHGYGAPDFAIEEASDAARHQFACTVTVADRLSTDPTIFDRIETRRRVLYLPDHVIEDRSSPSRPGPEFDHIVVSSATAAERCRALTMARGCPAIPVSVLHETIEPFNDDLPKDNLVVVASVFRLNAETGSIDVAALLNRFRNSMASVWKGIVLVDIAMGFDEGQLDRLRNRCERSGLRLIVNPQDDTLRSVLRRARIFVSIPSSSGSSLLEAGRTGRRRIATAIAADCITLVDATDPEVEICDGHDRCIRYDSISDLDERLLSAASVDLPYRNRGPSPSPETVRARWARFVAHSGKMLSATPVEQIAQAHIDADT